MSNVNTLGPRQLESAPLIAKEQLGHQLGSVLVLAPHPDDEALGCGGMMACLRTQNVPVHIVFITSGNASHLNSSEYPSPLLQSLREREALESCKTLGVSSTDVTFFRYPDGALANFSETDIAVAVARLSQLLNELNISSIFMPWRRDVHPDHKATSNFGFEATKKCSNPIQIVEYPIWLWNSVEEENWPTDEEIVVYRLNIASVATQKRSAIFAHKSQTTNLIKDDPLGFRLTPDLLSPFLGSYEYFFFNKDKKLDSLNKEYFDTLYANNPDPWSFKSSTYERTKYQKIDDIIGDRTFRYGLEIGCSIGVQTRFFAKHCQKLLAIDISQDAIDTAKRMNSDLLQTSFEVIDVTVEFPIGIFDFISLCEIGYYFNRETLLKLFKKITESLAMNGCFLMVHWTSYVREYPLTGREVHTVFTEYNADNNQFNCVSSYKHERYELLLWEKKSLR